MTKCKKYNLNKQDLKMLPQFGEPEDTFILDNIFSFYNLNYEVSL